MATDKTINGIYTEGQVIPLVDVMIFLRRHPGTIFVDLDDTVFNTCTRSFLIFMEWLERFEAEEVPDLMLPTKEVRTQQVQRLTMAARRLLASGRWPYLMGDAFDQIFAHARMKRTDLYGLREDFLDEWWKPRFFSNHYLITDQPNPGASFALSSFLGSPLYRNEIRICFLTGRHLANTNPAVPFSLGMRWGTQQALAAHGFGGYDVVYKDRWDISDSVFKRGFFECEFMRGRRGLQRPRVFVDNEPQYVNAFLAVAEQHDKLGDVLGVLYDGTGVRDPKRVVALRPEARVLKSFDSVHPG